MKSKTAWFVSLCVMGTCFAGATAATINCPGGRIAYSADGNQHDHDDIGATAASIAMVSAAGLGNRLVHYDFSNHLGNNSQEMERAMIESALGGAKRFGLSASRFFNDQTQLKETIDNFKREGNKSSEDDPLWYICAGPMDVAWRCVNAVDPDKRKYIHVISHHGWNDRHGDTPEMTHRWEDIGTLGATMHKIRNQNNSNGDHDFSSPLSEWQWLKNSDNENLKWLYSRNQFNDKFDISDSGMMYWLITGGPNGGNQKGGPNELRALLSNPVKVPAPRREKQSAGLNIGGYPDRIQRYGHGFSEPNDFTPEEYDYIARNYSIFTVEKRHAWGDYGPKPNTEAATIGTAKKLKEINPDIKVLLYWNIVLNWNFYESQTEFNKHPEWVFRDWVFRIANVDPVPMYDLNNPEVQEWWVNAIVDPVLRGDLDGVFLDASPKVPKEQYESLFKMIDTVRTRIGEDKIVIYNGFRVDETTLQGGQEFIDHTSGVFIEFFLHKPLDTKEEAAFLFDNLIEAERKGKMIIPRGNPKSVLPGTRQPFLFSLASFLLFHGPNSYYLYNSGYNKTQGMFEEFPEFDLASGKPLGSAVRKDWVYTRDFKQMTVTVDLETKEAKIEPHAVKP